MRKFKNNKRLDLTGIKFWKINLELITEFDNYLKKVGITFKQAQQLRENPFIRKLAFMTISYNFCQ